MKKVLLFAALSTISILPSISYAAIDPCLEALYSSNGTIDNCVINNLTTSTESNVGATSTTTLNVAEATTELNQTKSIESKTVKSEDASKALEFNAPTDIVSNNITYTAWEMIHRTPMLAGFMWTGPIANYITPNMYIGTPFGNGAGYLGSTNPFAQFLIGESTNYEECLRNESFISFGLGQRIESTDIKELKAIAKICAKEFYGSYFEGKSYTTREEFLMMLFTMFEEEQVGFQGHFENGNYVKSRNDGSITGYSNVDSHSWYASYLKLARYLTMVDPDETTWQTGKSITDTEAVEMLALYTAYRMNFEGDSMDRGVIQTEKMKYNLSFPTGSEIIMRIQ